MSTCEWWFENFLLGMILLIYGKTYVTYCHYASCSYRELGKGALTWKLKSVYILLFHLHYWKASFSQIEICEAKYVYLNMSNISEDVCWSIVLTCFYTAPIPFIKLCDRSMCVEKQVATEPHNAELSILQFCYGGLRSGIVHCCVLVRKPSP